MDHELMESMGQDAGQSIEWLAVINGKVLSDKNLSSSAKVVYGAIASFTANGTKSCFAGQSTIAERAGLKARSISRLVIELANAGYISVRQRGQRQTNLYELTTLKCVITKMGNPNLAGGDYAEMCNPSIKRIHEKNSIPIPQQAEDIYAHYASAVRRGGATDAIRSITTLLKMHSKDELIGAIDFYATTDQGCGEERFRYQANNFFGKKAYYKEFMMKGLGASSPSPPRELTVEERARRDNLFDAGLA